MKQLRFGLFENAQANDSGTATWRHPDSQRHNFDSMDYWKNITEISEDACLDFMFLADAWGWSDVNGQRPDIASVESLDLPRLDPAIVAAALITQTKNLGLVMTGSTLLEQPYNFARRMATLDHLSGGRMGWNVVTTGTAATAVQAFGVPMVAHDDRYDMADDFMEVVYKLWEQAWEPPLRRTSRAGLRTRLRSTGSPMTDRTLSPTATETPPTPRRAPRSCSKQVLLLAVWSLAASTPRLSSWAEIPLRVCLSTSPVHALPR